MLKNKVTQKWKFSRLHADDKTVLQRSPKQLE